MRVFNFSILVVVIISTMFLISCRIEKETDNEKGEPVISIKTQSAAEAAYLAYRYAGIQTQNAAIAGPSYPKPKNPVRRRHVTLNEDRNIWTHTRTFGKEEFLQFEFVLLDNLGDTLPDRNIFYRTHSVNYQSPEGWNYEIMTVGTRSHFTDLVMVWFNGVQYPEIAMQQEFGVVDYFDSFLRSSKDTTTYDLNGLFRGYLGSNLHKDFSNLASGDLDQLPFSALWIGASTAADHYRSGEDTTVKLTQDIGEGESYPIIFEEGNLRFQMVRDLSDQNSTGGVFTIFLIDGKDRTEQATEFSVIIQRTGAETPLWKVGGISRPKPGADAMRAYIAAQARRFIGLNRVDYPRFMRDLSNSGFGKILDGRILIPNQ